MRMTGDRASAFSETYYHDAECSNNPDCTYNAPYYEEEEVQHRWG
jgi:hypothetical protein